MSAKKQQQTAQEFFAQIQAVQQTGVLVIPKVRVAAGKWDGVGADIVLRLIEEHPDLSYGEFQDIFLAGLWWVQLWVAQLGADDLMAKEKTK